MKYKPKQKVMFKKYESQIAFCYENYRYGKNAYTIKFKRGSTELHRLRYEDELGQCSITSSGNVSNFVYHNLCNPSLASKF